MLSDSRFRIPLTQIRFGIDALIGLIPVLGDFIGLLLSLSILIEAIRMGAPRSLKLKILGNCVVDGMIGLIPIVGDLADVAFKANIRNMWLIQDYIASERQRRTETALNDSDMRRQRVLLGIATVTILAGATLLLLYVLRIY